MKSQDYNQKKWQCFKTLLCCYSLDFYNNGGANEGVGASGIPSVGPPYSTPEAPSQVSYGSYYQNDGTYTSPSTNKPPPKKKPPMSKAGMATISGPPRGTAGPIGGYQTGSSLGQGSYNQYGQGKKIFNQNQQSGASGYLYSTAYPSQVTGSAGSNQDYNYDGRLIWL